MFVRGSAACATNGISSISSRCEERVRPIQFHHPLRSDTRLCERLTRVHAAAGLSSETDSSRPSICIIRRESNRARTKRAVRSDRGDLQTLQLAQQRVAIEHVVHEESEIELTELIT